MLQQNVIVIITWLPVIFILSKTYFPHFEKYFKLYNVTLKNLLLFLFMYLCLCTHVCMSSMWVAMETRRELSGHLELGLQKLVSHLTLGAGNKGESSVECLSFYNHQNNPRKTLCWQTFPIQVDGYCILELVVAQ